MKKLTIFIAALSLAGCAYQSAAYEPQQTAPPSPPPTYWTKPSYTQVAFNADKYQCLQSAITMSHRDSPTISTQPYGDMGDFIQLANQNNLFSACMAAKGYTLQTGTVTPPDAKPAPKFSNMKMAYCLGVHQSIAKDMNDELQKSANSANVEGIKMGIRMENSTLEAISGYLAKAYDNNIPAGILAEVEKGNKDRAKMFEGKKSKYQSCVAPCHIDTSKSTNEGLAEYVNCSKKCEVYINNKERKVFDCIDIDKQLGS